VVIRKVLSKVWVVVLSEVQKESLGGGFIRSTKRKFGWWFYQKYKKKVWVVVLSEVQKETQCSLRCRSIDNPM
jgi:hypothetical protein